LLWLVLALGLVIFMMNEARKPDNWLWFAQLSNEGRAIPPASGPSPENPPDNRLKSPPQKEEIPGTFRWPGGVERPAEPQGAIAPRFDGVNPEYLEAIRDDTIFRHAECDAWFHLLRILEDTDEQTLERKSLGRVTFAQLFTLPNDYRGQLVTLYGTIRRARSLPAPKNDYAIERYYQLCLQPEDNRTTPMVVYCLHLPEGFPTGMKTSADVAVTGFFFKRWAYKAQDTVRTTPVVLARTVDWQRPTSRPRNAVEVNAVFLAIVFGAAILLSVAVSLYVYARTRAGPTAGVDKPETEPDFDALGQ